METRHMWHDAQIASDTIAEQLHMIAILTRKVEKHLGEHLGINLTDLAAMEHLITNRQLTPTELAARLDVTTAASTQIIDRLERSGHATRERQRDDRRKVLVVPNPVSMDQTFQQLAPILRGLDATIAALTDAERATIEQFLAQIVEVYRTAIAATDPTLEPVQQHTSDT